MEFATWALVLVTFVLALATFMYVIETRKMVKSMEREREELHRPVLSFQLVPFGATAVKLRIENVGSGAASNIHGEISSITKTGTASVPWSYPSLGPHKYEEFGIPIPGAKSLYNFNEVRIAVSEVKTNLTYKSASGISYHLDDSIGIEKLAVDWVLSRMLVTQDHPERIMPRIASVLERIEKAIVDLKS